jgi:hypothetical protein
VIAERSGGASQQELARKGHPSVPRSGKPVCPLRWGACRQGFRPVPSRATSETAKAEAGRKVVSG